jgi:uncharacterized protein (DUF1778 family)
LEYVGSTIKKEAFMAIATPEQPKDRRFQLRATAREETLIKVAAEREGVNVTDFILSAAREKAAETLADQTRFVLHEEQWREFMKALDRPAREKPRLRRLFTESHVAKRRSR